MFGIPCDELLPVLRSAGSDGRDDRVALVVEGMRREWLKIARMRFAVLGDDVQDVIQAALMKVLAPEKLASVTDVDAVDRWARSIFVNTALDFVRDGQRRRARFVEPALEDDCDEDGLHRFPAPDPTPDEIVQCGERLEIIRRGLGRLEVAWLRYVEDLPEQEVAERLGSTRDAVATRLKRFRRWLREQLEEAP